MPDEQKPIPLLYDTYLAVIQNSVGTKMFRHFYALKGGQRRDLVEGGYLACAYFVTFILYHFRLIEKPHLTVVSTQNDLQKSGWVTIAKPKRGAVLIWPTTENGDAIHKHIGFSLGDDRAVSTSSAQKIVHTHDDTFGGKRPIESVWWHPNLNHEN